MMALEVAQAVSQPGMVHADWPLRHGSCMSLIMNEETNEQARENGADVERECETWDWVRPAGVSAQELREAVRSLLNTAQPSA
jgi:hypothetical protein